MYESPLRIARQRAGFKSASAAALALGVDPAYWRKWEAGSHRPQVGWLARITSAFGITAGQILGLEPLPEAIAPTTPSSPTPHPKPAAKRGGIRVPVVGDDDLEDDAPWYAPDPDDYDDELDPDWQNEPPKAGSLSPPATPPPGPPQPPKPIVYPTEPSMDPEQHALYLEGCGCRGASQGATIVGGPTGRITWLELYPPGTPYSKNLTMAQFKLLNPITEKDIVR